MMGPLTGLRVLDFSTLLPGPFATRQMADLGAEVVRVVSPRHPDLMQQFPPSEAYLNGDKRRVLLDLTEPDAPDQVRQLLGDIDIVLEQFRPGVMARFGLDYDSLRSEFPQLIYCSLTGYGQTGPLRDAAGHDINYQALSGLASYGGGDRPYLTAVPVADMAGSLNAVIAMLAALHERDRTGRGQYLDIAMADSALKLNAMEAPRVLEGAPSPEAGQSWLNGGLFYDYYQCADGRWVSVGGLEPKFIQALCDGLERPDWVNRFLDPSPSRQQGLKADLQALFAGQPRSVWLQRLSGDCCVEPVLTLAEALAHPHFIERGVVACFQREDR